MKKYKYLTYFLLCFSWQTLQAQASNLNTFCSNYTDTLALLQDKSVKAQCDLAGYHWSIRLNAQEEKKTCLALDKNKTTMLSRKRERSRILSALSNMIKLCESESYAQRSINYDELGILEKDKYTERLIAAVKKDDVRAVKQLVLQGADPFYELDMNFGTPLYHAIAAQAKQSVKFLIDLGGSPNRTCNGCGNPLNNLLKNKVVDYGLLTYLLSNGSDPDYSGEATNPSPVNIAVQNNDFKATALLLEHGAKWFESSGDSPALVLAAEHNNLALMELLLKHGADPDGSAPCSMSPMFYAKGDVKMRELLVKYGAMCSAY